MSREGEAVWGRDALPTSRARRCCYVSNIPLALGPPRWFCRYHRAVTSSRTQPSPQTIKHWIHSSPLHALSCTGELLRLYSCFVSGREVTGVTPRWPWAESNFSCATQEDMRGKRHHLYRVSIMVPYGAVEETAHQTCSRTAEKTTIWRSSCSLKVGMLFPFVAILFCMCLKSLFFSFGVVCASSRRRFYPQITT